MAEIKYSKKHIRISEQDRAFIEYLSEGYSIPEISTMTDVNTRTIEHHLYLIRKQTGTKTIAHLVAKFIREGWIK